MMRRYGSSRRHRLGLLARPPCGIEDFTSGRAALVVDPVEQLAELADLRRRGLLSAEEFERHEAKLLEP
jgi:hypothetical protein